MNESCRQALFALIVALVCAAAAAQPVSWQRSFGAGSGSNSPVQVVGDGAGGVYVARIDASVSWSLTRLDPLGAVLWTVPLAGFGGCAQCFFGIGPLTADASGAYLVHSTFYQKGGSCGLPCSETRVSRFAAADGARTAVFGVVGGPFVGVGRVDSFASAGSGLIIGGIEGNVGLLARRGGAAFTVKVGDAFEKVAAGPGDLVAATLRTGSTWSLRVYAGAGVLQWSSELGTTGCDVLVTSATGRVACVTGTGVRVYTTTGSFAWDLATPDAAYAAAQFDGSGNLWLAGGRCTLVESLQTCKPQVWKHDPSGTSVASDAAPVPNGLESWTALSVARNGDAYVSSKLVTARYDATGARRWITTPGRSLGERDNVVAFDDGVVVGGIDRSAPTQDVTVWKLGAAPLIAPGLAVSVPPVVRAGESVAITVTVAGSPTPTGSVSILDGTNELCEVSLVPAGANAATASCVIALGVGDHVLTAMYAGDGVFGGSSVSSSPIRVADAGVVDVPVLSTPWLVALSLLLTLVLAVNRRR